MMIHLPTEIRSERIFNRARNGRFGGSHMMFVSVAANELQQFLKLRHLDDSITAERVELVIGELAFADVGDHFAGEVVGGNAAIGEWAGADAADDRAVGVLFVDGTNDD